MTPPLVEWLSPTKVLTTMPQVSLALTAPRSGGGIAAPEHTVMFEGHVIVGGVMSTRVTLWLQVLLLPRWSMAAHVRVAENVRPHNALVTVPRMTIRFVPQASA